MGGNHENLSKPALIRMDRDDPPLFSCAVCGWAPGCSGTAGPLIWSVIEHWLMTHWELGPGGQAR